MKAEDWSKTKVGQRPDNQRLLTGKSSRIAEAHAITNAALEKVELDLLVTMEKNNATASLNKTELAWYHHLQAMQYPWIGIHAIKLKLAGKTFYTPDFETIGPNGEMIFWEVKGFMRDDAAVKLKVAANLYRWARFILVRKLKGSWQQTEIKP